MAKTRRAVIRLAALFVSTASPALAFAQGSGDPADPESWRTPEFRAQWGLYQIYADLAYARGFDGSGIRVGVVDSGLDIHHSEFAGRYAEGITYNSERPWNRDDDGHGSAVTAVIAANRDGIGMHGVAPGATIVQANADAGDGYNDNDAVNYGIRRLVDRGVRIINNSYGSGSITDYTAEAFEADDPEFLATSRYAVSNGALLIFGAANDGAPQPSVESGLPHLFPELERGWLAVIASGPGYLPQYTNLCGVAANWCLVAPGGGRGWEWDPDLEDLVWKGLEDGLLVAKPGGGYVKTYGTSLAGPHVAGAAALVAQAFPYMTMDQVRQVLLGTAADWGEPGVDEVFGYGMLNVGKAVLGPGKFDWGDFNADVPSGTSTWENDITGKGGLVKSGDGVLLLTGHSTYLGDTRVVQGVLGVNGSIASDMFVGPDAMLSGNGVIHGDVVNDGIVYGGYSYRGGTLTVDGNYAQSANAGLMVMVGAENGTSRLDVTGSATLSGWVDAFVPAGAYQGPARYTILSAQGGIGGRFQEDCGCYAFLDLTLSYDPNTVYLDVARNATAFADLAATRNGAAAAASIERLGIGQPLHDLVVTLAGDEAVDLFEQLPGEVYGSTVTGLIENSQLIGSQINDRLRSAFETVGATALPLIAYGDDAKDLASTSAAAEHRGAWGSAFGSWGRTEGDGNAGRLSRSTGGLVTGIDGQLTEAWRLGFLAGYSHSSFKLDERDSSASSDNYHLGVYGGAQWGAVSFRSGLAYTWSDIDSGRQIAFYDLSDSLTASYRAGTTQLFGELGYAMKAGAVAVEPFANLAYVNVHTGGFTETGGPVALSVHRGGNDVTFSTFGLRASTDFGLGTAKATARGMAGWRHAYGDVTPTLDQAFANGNAFTVAGSPVAEDSAVLEAGLDLAIAPAATVGVSYRGQVASDAQDHGFRADLSVKF